MATTLRRSDTVVDFERPDARVYREELTPLAFVERSGSVHADRIAVVDGNRRYTYRDWRIRARQFASGLREAGMRKGERIAFLALNSEQLLLAHFAVPMAGGVLVAINTRLSAPEVAYIVAHSGARRIFYSPELASLLASLTDQVTRCDIGRGFERFLAAGNPDPIDSGLTDEEQMIAIDYTSGTTGHPKGVMYTHRSAALNALAMIIHLKLSADSRYLWTLPMFHCNGWCITWALAAVGATSFCIPRVDPTRVWELLDRERITHYNGAPTVQIMLANDPGAHRLSHRVTVTTGGAPPSPTLIARLAELNLQLEHVYGLTETYAPFTINEEPPGAETLAQDERSRLKARQGVPHILAGQLRVVDDAMRDVPADGTTMGEVVMRGNIVTTGYYRAPELTAEAFAGGWFHTGDIAVMHPDGSIELRDRKKDIIISGGENISTIEVEQTISTHPAVLECAVIAIPDEKWGEVPKAFVALKPGGAAIAEEIIEHCRERMTHFKCPKAVAFGELPKTSTGKVQKYVLREREWQGYRRRIN